MPAVCTLCRLEQALTAANGACDAYPYLAKALKRRATVFLKLGNPKDAVEDLLRVVWLDPSDTATRTLLADTSVKAGVTSRVLHIDDEDDWPTMTKQSRNRVILTDYFASWCGPCKMLSPHVDRLSLEFPHVIFAKVDGDNCTEVCMQAKVTGFPTVDLYYNGRVLDRMVGADVAKLRSMVVSHGGGAGAATFGASTLVDAPDAGMPAPVTV